MTQTQTQLNSDTAVFNRFNMHNENNKVRKFYG